MNNLTADQIQQNADAVKSHLENRPVEVRMRYNADDPWNISACPQWEFALFIYRPKAESITRPWSNPDDVPGPVCWVRHSTRSNGSTGMMVIGLDAEGVEGMVHYASVELLKWKDMEQWEYSTDRREWKPCEVTEG